MASTQHFDDSSTASSATASVGASEHDEICRAVRQYVTREFPRGAQRELFDDDFNIIEEGGIDSVWLMNFITWIEGQFQIQLEMDDIVPQNLKSVRSVVQLVIRVKNVAER